MHRLAALRQWMLPLCLALVSALAALGAGEILVRFARPEFRPQPDPMRSPFWHPDAELGWTHQPGQQGLFSREEFTHPVSINAAGWRDRERVVARTPGVARIAVLGDSFTWGHGVPDDEIFTRLMEALMPDVEVLNFGLSGSSTDQQLLILRRAVLAYKPDLLLVMVSRNDFNGNLKTQEGIYPKPMFVLESGGALRLTNVPVPPVAPSARAGQWLSGHSALYNLGGTWFQQPEERASGDAADPIAVTCALLDAIHHEAAGAGAAMTAALVPSTAHTYLDPIPQLDARRYEGVKECGSRLGFGVLDLVPAFRALGRGGETGTRVELFWRLDKHWNARGHQLAAQELARQIAENHLLPVGRQAGRL